VGEIKHERVREKIKFECARVIQQKLRDPRAGFMTVQNVELSHDFRNAKIFVSILGSDADKRKSMRMLEDARGFIQREVAHTLRTRVTPQLKFVLDTSVDKSFRVAELLDQIKKENPGSLDPSGDAKADGDDDESDDDESDDGWDGGDDDDDE
jgi:ribosome-binding factor A